MLRQTTLNVMLNLAVNGFNMMILSIRMIQIINTAPFMAER